MRERLALGLGLGLALASSSALAGPAPGPGPTAKVKPIEMAKMRDKLDVWRDDSGHYVVDLREPGDDTAAWVFYGDGKTMYQQRVFGTGSSQDGQDLTLWSPRVSEQAGAAITLSAHDGPDAPRSKISCGPKAERALALLPADQAKGFIARATFLPPLWQRSSHFIARDDDGTYYFVDELRDDFGGGMPRFFMGKKAGQMKEAPLTNVVSDPAGEIFATQDGSLKTFGATANKPPVWRHGDKLTELTVLDLTEPATRLIIYRDFAIYGALGTPCD